MKSALKLFLIFGFALPLSSEAWAGTISLEGYPDRPIREKLSSSPSQKLVILLHPFKTSKTFMGVYYPMGRFRDGFGFNLVIPSGSKNRKNQRHWNAGKECCDFYHDGADDLLFLDQLIGHYKATLGVKEVYLIGHSNGGFMAHHYFCNGSEKITGIFSFAGNPPAQLKDCKNQNPMGTKVIVAHGLKDKRVSFKPVPGFIKNYEESLGCSSPKLASRENFTINRIGDDFRIYRSQSCRGKNALEFWEHFNGGHIPRFKPRYFKAILKSLLVD